MNMRVGGGVSDGTRVEKFFLLDSVLERKDEGLCKCWEKYRDEMYFRET